MAASLSPATTSFPPTPRTAARRSAPSIRHRRPSHLRRWRPCLSASSAPLVDESEAMGVEALRQFVHQNLGVWNGSLRQFDAAGNLLQNVSTRLSASSYGEGELLSLIQALYIKQAPSRTVISEDDDNDEPEWVEYKIKETNIFTVDKYQQIGYFPNERAFSLRYQTIGMLETVLRIGVLGEDDTGEESPRDLSLPSRRPSVVCENCLYSMVGNSRARAFHILDPKGVLEMVFIFLEQSGGPSPISSSQSSHDMDATDRLKSVLGRWEGHSKTKRTGVYGATIAEHESVAVFQMDDNGQIIQDISLTSYGDNTATSNVHWCGQISDNTILFEEGFQITLLPGGMYVGCPVDVSKSVAQLQSFHLEFCWMESPTKRQRLVRTYDSAGLAVSSTYFQETKV